MENLPSKRGELSRCGAHTGDGQTNNDLGEALSSSSNDDTNAACQAARKNNVSLAKSILEVAAEGRESSDSQLVRHRNPHAGSCRANVCCNEAQTASNEVERNLGTCICTSIPSYFSPTWPEIVLHTNIDTSKRHDGSHTHPIPMNRRAISLLAIIFKAIPMLSLFHVLDVVARHLETVVAVAAAA